MLIYSLFFPFISLFISQLFINSPPPRAAVSTCKFTKFFRFAGGHPAETLQEVEYYDNILWATHSFCQLSMGGGDDCWRILGAFLKAKRSPSWKGAPHAAEDTGIHPFTRSLASSGKVVFPPKKIRMVASVASCGRGRPERVGRKSDGLPFFPRLRRVTESQ